jgi:hypothetical protein
MRSLRQLARAAAAASAVLVLGACSNTKTGCTLPPLIYNGPAVINPTLISPAAGATGVSTGPLDVTLGSAFGVIQLYLRDPSGNVTYAPTLRQANPPSNDVRIGTFPQLATQTVYQVFATINVPSYPSDPCAANPTVTVIQTPQLLGSFTTR